MTPWAAAFQAPLSSTISWSLLKFISMESVMQSNHPIICHSFSFCLQPSLASGSFSTSQLCIRWPMYWSFSFSNSHSNEYLRLIFFRIDWFDLAVQGTLKSLLQNHLLQTRSLKTSVLLCSAFFMVQLSCPYMTTENTIVLTVWTLVGKVMSLLFNTLSRFVITFLPRRKHGSISCCSHHLQ